MSLRRLAGRLLPVACCVAVSASSLQEPPPRTLPPEPTGTGRITGHVVAADSGTAVKRATVSIVGRSQPVRLPGARGRGGVPGVGTVSMGVVGGVVGSGPGVPGQTPQRVDEAGRFEFANLAAGRYGLMVQPQGGFVRPQRPIEVEVTDGGTATTTIRLERTGVIAGRVLDENGEPVSRVQVGAMRRQGVGGSSRMTQTAMSVSTDDLGQFRLFDLEPGEYFVSATYRIDLSGLSAPGAVGYAPTYYPGTAALSSAQAVTVRSARDTSGIDFALARVAMGRITGTVRDSAGQVAQGSVSVSLTPREVAGPGQFGAGTRPDGTFVIQNIPPGEYYLIGSLSRPGGANAEREGAFVPVTVNGDEQQVDLRLNTGATIRGRVVIEGTPQALPPEIAARMQTASSGISVSVRPVSFGGSMSMVTTPRSAPAAEDGTFQLTGVRGRVTLMASGYRASLKSITQGAQDFTGKPMEFKGTERVSGMTITLTTEVGTILGTVTNDAGEPSPEASIVVFPDDPERWFPGSPFVHVSRALPASIATSANPPMSRPGMPPPAPRVPGGFSVPGLVEGRYLVAAIESSFGMPPLQPDREALEKLRPKAAAVSVSAGQSASVTLRALKPF